MRLGKGRKLARGENREGRKCENEHSNKRHLKVNAIPVTIPISVFTEIEKKSMLKFILNYKRLWITKTIFNKKISIGKIAIPDFKI